MRLRGQHVPQAPHRAHGQLNCVVSAPVCLFPSRRPQDSLLKPFCAASARSPGQIAWRTAHLDEWEAVLIVTIITPPHVFCQAVVKKLLAESVANQIPECRASPPGHRNLMSRIEILPLADPRSISAGIAQDGACRARMPRKTASLHFDGRTGISKLLLDGLGFVLRNALFHRLWCAVHQVLGFLQTQASEPPQRPRRHRQPLREPLPQPKRQDALQVSLPVALRRAATIRRWNLLIAASLPFQFSTF